MPAPKSHCSLDLPLDTSFNFAGWRKQPADLPIPSDMDLQERNQHNCDVTTENRASIRATRAYKEQLQNGNTPPIATDIGKKLRAFYTYSSDELEKMIDSEAYCAHVVAPIPPKLLQYLLEARDKRSKAAEKKEEEEKLAKEKGTGLKGSMVMSGVTKANVLTCPAVSTPETLQAAIKYKLHPSLFWFTDPRLIWATENPAELPMIKNTTINAAPEKSLLDVPKMKTIWGSDDTAEGHDVLDWTNASDNFLTALKTLCTAPDPNNPSSYAIEMGKHQDFFRAMDDFRSHFPAYWASQVDGVLNAWKAAKEVWGELRPRSPRRCLTLPLTLQLLDSSTANSPVMVTTTAQHEMPMHHHVFRIMDGKVATPLTMDGKAAIPFVTAAATCRTTTHFDRVPSHHAGPSPASYAPATTPSTTTCPRRSTLKTAHHAMPYMKTARATGGERKVICIGWNINSNGRQCNGANHPAERLHICSLCGASDHAALPGNPRCRHFKNGTLNP
ncbi:hypothetical protein DFH07DRAFT_765016 [Mycena maculata]|uniref:Uncharacterized protein n=1 Tax=Mycena maculata TaxID=230809 RepID=A0AAD7NZH1_9AGAR|nr:hypothetical protein DFH07DRAFT_765016 [Mycena maculata]